MKNFLLFLFFVSINFLGFSQSVARTILSTTYDGKIVEGSNTIYCSSFDNMWLQLREVFHNQEIPDSVLRSIDKSVVKSKTIEDSSFTTIIKTVSNAIEVSSKLYKEIDFSDPFDEEFNLQVFDATSRVDCFGFKLSDPNPRRNLELIDYRNENDFIMKVNCKDSLDEVYFAKVQNKSTLEATYRSVAKRLMSGNHQSICENDIVKIPYLKIDTVFKLNDLISKEFADNWFFKNAEQKTLFDLNKKGITIESTSSSIVQFADYEEQGFYLLAFNQPFLVVLKKKNFERPYFLMWVGNDEFMKSYSIDARIINANEKKFVGKWKASKVTEGTRSYDTNDLEYYRNLKSDGTYEDSVRSKKRNEGSWSYNDSTKSITFKPLRIDENSKVKIERCVQINDSELILINNGYETIWIKKQIKLK
jgi:hypothetical protein